MSTIQAQNFDSATALDGSRAMDLESFRQALRADAELAGPRTGWVVTDFGGYDTGNSVALQPDGKVLVAGYTWVILPPGKLELDVALARYNPDGSLDKSFSGDGKLTTAWGDYDDYGESVAMQPDGKILVVGASQEEDTDFDFAIARYNADGSLDKGFSGDGKLVTDIGGYSWGNSIVLQPDGKILVAGSTDNNNTGTDFALARYNTDGSLDTSFSGNGTLITDVGGYSMSHGGFSYGQSVALQPDGKILVAGYSGDTSGTRVDFALARYNADGSLDKSFSGDGKLTTDFGDGHDWGKSVALQPDGKILVAGSSQHGSSFDLKSDFALARYNTDGSLDKGFSGDGKLITDFGGYDDSGYSVAVQPDGKILVVGSSKGGFALARYTPDGSLDTSFSGDGKLTTTAMGSSGNAAYSVAMQPDGKILVTGIADGIDFALARYNADGSLDTTFGYSPPTGSATAQLPAGKEDTAYVLKASDLLQGFTNPGGDPLSVTGLAADHGTLAANGDFTWTFAPEANYNGAVALSYTVTDGQGGNVAAQQSFTLAAVNDAPTVKPEAFVVAENSAQGMPVGQADASDVDGDALAYRLASGNADWDGDGRPAFALDAKTGTLSVNDPGDLDFEAHPAFALQVKATDPGGLSSQAAITVNLANLNEIQGTPGPDTLRGTSGRDWLDGGAGDDRLAGGRGDDTLLGGDGSDRADFSGCLAPIKADLALGQATGQGADVLISVENITGGIAEDTLLGDANPNIFWGGPGDDNLEGNAGADRLGGGLGNDTLKGGAGSDTLYGSKGLDTLAGGSGADRFVYKAAIDTGNTVATRDVVADFSHADGDKIDVGAWDAKPSVAGLQHWSFGVGFTGVAAQIRFDAASHLVLFDQDGDKQADFQIELTGVAALSSTDFVLA